MILENLGIPDIAAQRIDGPVPAHVHHFGPTRSAWVLTISPTLWSVSRSPTLPPFRIERNSGPVMRLPASRHAPNASTGQAIEPRIIMPMVAPWPS
jgi:hypothetical protein